MAQISYRKGRRGYAIVVDGFVVGAINRRVTKRKIKRSSYEWRLVLLSGGRHRFKTFRGAKAAAEAMLLARPGSLP